MVVKHRETDYPYRERLYRFPKFRDHVRFMNRAKLNKKLHELCADENCRMRLLLESSKDNLTEFLVFDSDVDRVAFILKWL